MGVGEQIVVSCRRAIGEVEGELAAAHLERARGLTKKAEALGATLTAWGGTTLTFAFEPHAIDEAIQLAVDLLLAGPEHGEAWACGVAQGELAPFERAADHERARAKLSWGRALVVAEALASIAKPGEIVCARDLPALRARLLTPLGRRAGYDEARRVRGVAIDPRQPWRRDAEACVARVVEPPMFGRDRLQPVLSAPGTLSVINAEPGLGGSRFMRELAASIAPSPALIVSPVGTGMEPLGSLRHAFARFMVTHPERIGAELLPLLDRLLTGTGVDAKNACALILTALVPGRGEPPGALLIDDANEVDEETVEVCARAAKAAGESLHLAVRSDGTWDMPPVLTRLPHGVEVTLSPYGRRDGEAFTAACLGGQLTEGAQERWARRGGYTPLGMLEALTTGFASGDLDGLDSAAKPRRRFAGKGRARDATEWIRDRVVYLDEPLRAFVSALALLGGQATLANLTALLRALGVVGEPRAMRKVLIAQRWLRKVESANVALPSRTHARALMSLLDEETAHKWHAAASEVIAREPSVLALGDAAYHASKAKDPARAAQLARAAADVAKRSGLDDGAARLIAFARSVTRSSSSPRGLAPDAYAETNLHDEDPTNELRLSGAFRAAAPVSPSALDTSADVSQVADLADFANESAEYDTMTDPVGTTDMAPPPNPSGSLSDRADRADGSENAGNASDANDVDDDPPEDTLSMARDPSLTLLRSEQAAKNGSAEVSGTSNVITNVLAKPSMPPRPNARPESHAERALAREANAATARSAAPAGVVGYGKIPEILRLRALKSGADTASLAARCQASLGLGVALASAGRVEEALLEGLEALARAREEENERGLEACLAFLAKIFARVSRPDEARRLGMAARRPVDERLRPPY